MSKKSRLRKLNRKLLRLLRKEKRALTRAIRAAAKNTLTFNVTGLPSGRKVVVSWHPQPNGQVQTINLTKNGATTTTLTNQKVTRGAWTAVVNVSGYRVTPAGASQKLPYKKAIALVVSSTAPQNRAFSSGFSNGFD